MLLGHGWSHRMADGAPCVVAHGLDQHVTACAFTPLELLLVTAHTALGRVALGALGDLGGVHGPLKGDEVALGFAFHRMTGGTGHGIARVVTGLAVFDFFLMDEMVENHGFHGRALGIGLFADRKDDHGRRRAAVRGFQGSRGRRPRPPGRQTRRASQGHSRQQKQCCAIPHVLVLLHTDITPIPGAASARVTSGPRPPAGDKHLDCGKASSGREIRQGGC